MLGRAAQTFGSPADSGVLILGASGSGKSDLALRLIERGASLVADDRVDLFVTDGRLKARAPERLAGLIEIRGLGIMTFPYEAEATLGLAVELVDSSDTMRMPEPMKYRAPPSLELPEEARPPLVKLAALHSSTPAKVLAAAALFAHARFCEDRKTL